METTPLSERLGREWLDAVEAAVRPALPSAHRYVVELDASDADSVTLSINDSEIATSAVRDMVRAGAVAVSIAALLPSVTGEQAKRIRRIIVEVE